MTTDATLVARAHRGDRTASAELVERYTDAAYGIATRFYMPGGDADDVRQEALVAILRAIRTYREGHGVPFAGFVRMCIYRWLVYACIKRAQAEKQRPLTRAMRTIRDEEGEIDTAVSFLEDHRADVPQLAEDRAELRRVIDALWHMTRLERVSVVGIAFGYSYREIEETLGTHFKGADNAIQRGRQKLRKAA